jgi:DNA-binding winged helix-turn-helix (wHTH) protein
MIDQPTRQLRFGAFLLDIERCALSCDELPVPLRRQSFDTLRYLAERSGRVISRAEIAAAVCGSSPADPDASVFQCIKEIRKALGGDSRWMIRTIPGTGYEFKAAVLASSAAEATSTPRDEEATHPESPVTALASNLYELIRWQGLTGVVVLVAFLVLPIVGNRIWSTVPAAPSRDAARESFLYRPVGRLALGTRATIQTSDGRAMTCIGGGVTRGISRQCWWN